jgi:hypothetical protein
MADISLDPESDYCTRYVEHQHDYYFNLCNSLGVKNSREACELDVFAYGLTRQNRYDEFLDDKRETLDKLSDYAMKNIGKDPIFFAPYTLVFQDRINLNNGDLSCLGEPKEVAAKLLDGYRRFAAYCFDELKVYPEHYVKSLDVSLQRIRQYQDFLGVEHDKDNGFLAPKLSVEEIDNQITKAREGSRLIADKQVKPVELEKADANLSVGP